MKRPVPEPWPSSHYTAIERSSQTAVARESKCIDKKEETYTQKYCIDRMFRAYKVANIAWWEYNRENGQYYTSDELYFILGLDKETYSAISIEVFLSLVHPDNRAELRYHFSQLLKQTHYSFESRLIKSCGTIIYVQHYAETERNEHGHVTKIYGITKNITHHKEAQIALEASERKANEYARKLEDTLNHFGDGFITVDRNWNITFWNQKAEFMSGVSKEQALRGTICDLFPGSLPLRFYTECNRALKENVAVHFEEHLSAFDLWAEISAYPTESGLSVYFKNVNEKKKREQEQKISNERFELVSRATLDAVWDWDIQTDYCYYNEWYEKAYGHCSEKKDVSRIWTNHIHAGDRNRIWGSIQIALQDPNVSLWEEEYRFYRKDGSIAYVQDRGIILREESGKAIRMIGAMRDVTEMVRLQQVVIKEKVEAQKGAAKAIINAQEQERSVIGKELHDNVNQLLTTAKLYVENIDHFPGQRELFLQKSITLIQKSINEIRYLSKALVTPTLSDIGFEATLNELVEQYRELRLFELNLVYQVTEQGLETELKLTIYRILQELLNNTVKYAKASRVVVTLQEHNQNLQIIYEDNGVGFDLSSKKSGLGLNNIKNRVEIFKGKVRFFSDLGKGCRALIVFPR